MVNTAGRISAKIRSRHWLGIGRLRRVVCVHLRFISPYATLVFADGPELYLASIIAQRAVGVLIFDFVCRSTGCGGTDMFNVPPAMMVVFLRISGVLEGRNPVRAC